MEAYLVPIKTAVIIFPLIAALITLPYMLYEYRKFGGIPFLRTTLLYSFVLYLLVVYFLVILPLPSFEEVAKLTTPIFQWLPFQFIADIMKESHIIWGNFSTYLTLFQNSAFYGVLLNILMILPFGIYLRYYFKCSLKKTILFSFLLSLFFEVTQLTGLYGIYPRPYRLFDIDDLMMNTLGGTIGYAIAPLFVHFLPSKDRLNEISYEKGKSVTFMRRLMAFGIDWIILGIGSAIVSFFLSIPHMLEFYQHGNVISYLIFFLSIVLYFVIIPYFWRGRTFGKAFVRIHIVSETGKKASFGALFLRCFLLYGLFLGSPVVLNGIRGLVVDIPFLYLGAFFVSLLFVVLKLCFCFQVFMSVFQPKKRLWHEIWSHTREESCVINKNIHETDSIEM